MSFRRVVPKVGLEPTSREALVPKTSVYTIPPLWQFAPRDGFEPTTTRLTVEGSTAELSRNLVGKTGLEPATPWSQTKCATGLRYFPFLLQFAL